MVYNLTTQTCKGVLCDDRLVNPTMSEKKMVTESKVSASTDFPFLSCSATDLIVMGFRKIKIIWLKGWRRRRFNGGMEFKCFQPTLVAFGTIECQCGVFRQPVVWFSLGRYPPSCWHISPTETPSDPWCWFSYNWLRIVNVAVRYSVFPGSCTLYNCIS